MTRREHLVVWYDRLTGLIEKLPGPLQKAILGELEPIREVVLDQRAARLALVGGAGGMTVPALLDWLGAGVVATGESVAGWRSYRVEGRGTVEVCDARGAGGVVAEDADVVVEVRGGGAAMLGGDAIPAGAGVVWDCAGQPDEVAERICAALPAAAKLEFARLVAAKGVQRELGASLVRSFTAVCSVIGVQPIPLADLPVLASLQSVMVGLIIHVSGRKVSPRLVAEFVGAMGVNFGAGLLFREGARALVKVVPIWGNAISGAVAGAGTYAIGRAAIAYFVDDVAMEEARRIFRRRMKGAKTKDPAAIKDRA